MASRALGLTEPLDFESEIPVYEQIKNRIRFAIARGVFGEGAQLPSVRTLARALLVNPNTASRVYRDLESEGLIETRQRRGAWVAEAALERCRLARTALFEASVADALRVARLSGLAREDIDEVWDRLRQAFDTEEQTCSPE